MKNISFVLAVVMMVLFLSVPVQSSTTQSVAALKEIVKALETLERYGWPWLQGGHKASEQRVKILHDVFEKAEKMRRSSVESFAVFAYDKKMNYLAHKVIAVGNEKTVLYKMKDLLDFIHLHKAHAVITAHNHPGILSAYIAIDVPHPSSGDFESARHIIRELRKCNVEVFDDVVLSRNTLYSMRINHPELWR